MPRRYFAALFISLLCVPVLAVASARSGLPTLDPVAQGVISEAIAAKDPAYRMAMEGRSVRAHNPRQSLSAALGAEGMAISVAESKWRLQLTGWGRSENLREAPATATRVKANRLEVERGAITEWWANGPVGLQQGWTVAERPAGRGALVLALAQSGELRATVSEPTALEIRDRSDRAVMRYGGLTALDARGRKLPVRFDVRGHEVRIQVDDANALYPLLIDPIAQQAYLKASNMGAGDGFAWSVAISGDTMVVGAPLEDSNATAVNGNQADNSASNAGAVYVFVRSGAAWSQQAYLKASNAEAGDVFGWSVSISGDTIVVGAYGEDSNATGVNGDQADNSASNAGAAYVFVRSAGGVWSEQAYLKASNTGTGDEFGTSVAISGDTIVVGASDEFSNATGVDGNQADNSVILAGAAYVFVRSGATWSQQAYLKASNTGTGDQFGNKVAISGDTVVVGAPLEGSNATGVDGNQANNSAGSSGAAYVFVRSGATWSQQAYLKASNTGTNHNFGTSVAISDDTIVVGATGEGSNATGVDGDGTDNSATAAGAAYVFVRSGASWSQQAYLKAFNSNAVDIFGSSVAISGDTIVVGATGEDSNATGVNGNQADNSASGAGAAYVFMRSGATWSPRAYLKASNTAIADGFGYSAAISGGTIVVGATGEDSNATGVNGNQADNSASNAGAAYAFLVTAPQVSSIVPAGTNPTNAASVDFTVTFDSAVTGVDATDFALTTTGVAGASVTGVSGSGTTYTVTVGTGTGTGTIRLDVTDDDTIVSALPLGGAGTGNGGFTTGTAYTIDRTGPAVTSVAVPANANYFTGQNLDFTINWDDAVTVTGTPQLALTIGATTRQAGYVSGSGTGALLFRYTVQAADNDQDGIAVGVLGLNGGALQDALGNDATLTLNAVATTSGVFVNRTFTVTPSMGPNGAIAPATPQAVLQGNAAVFAVTPNAGYTAVVGGTCGGALVADTYTTNAVTANCTVVASFTQNAYTVTSSAGPNGTISPLGPQVIAHGNVALFTVTPGVGYVATVGGTCGGALVADTYTTNAVTANCTVAATFTASPTTTFTGPSATGTGNITASFTGGGPACTFTHAQFIAVEGDAGSPPTGTRPADVEFPHGLFDFTLGGCTPGSTVTMTITYPTALPQNTWYWKYGPTSSNAAPHWYVLGTGFSGTSITFSITDGGVGDDDLAANGTIVDQGGPGTGAGGVTQVPTLSEWAMMLLASLMLLSGLRRVRGSMSPSLPASGRRASKPE